MNPKLAWAILGLVLVTSTGLAFLPQSPTNPPLDILIGGADDPQCHGSKCVWKVADPADVVQGKLKSALTPPKWSYYQADLTSGQQVEIFVSEDWEIRLVWPVETEASTNIVTRRKGLFEKVQTWLGRR